MPSLVVRMIFNGAIARQHYLLHMLGQVMLKNKGFVLISDSLKHNKLSVYAFMTCLINLKKFLRVLKRSISSVTELVLSSSRNNCSQIFYEWEQEFNLVLKWNFFCNLSW